MGKISGIAKNQILIFVIVAAAVFAGIIVVSKLDTMGNKGSGLNKEYVYSLEGQIKVDPALILYTESSGPIKTGFNETHAAAADKDGIIYAAGDNSIREFDSSGNLKDEIKLDAGPRAVTVSDDKIYIGMKDRIKVYDRQTKQFTDWQKLNEDAVLTSIAVWNNDVFAADAGNRIVLRYDRDGKLINTIGKKNAEKNIPGFVIPSPYFDLAVGSDGLLRVVNPGMHRIEAYTLEGDLEFSWGKYSSDIEGFCGCCNPVNFAILKDGSFVTAEKGLTRVKVYSPEGKFTGVVAGTEQLLYGGEAHICQTPANCQTGGFDVAIDNQQRVIVLDTIKNEVRIFTKKKI